MSTAVSRRLRRRRRRLFAECSVLVNPVWVQASRAISNGRIIIIVALKAVPTVCLSVCVFPKSLTRNDNIELRELKLILVQWNENGFNVDRYSICK